MSTLPTASAANQVPFSIGSGGIYEAREIVIPPGSSHGKGLFSALPVSPKAGDTYKVTLGTRCLGYTYICLVDGLWQQFFTDSNQNSMLADVSGTLGATNSFHLIEPSGQIFIDQGSSPQTITETGVFRRQRLGPRSFVPGLWPPVAPGTGYLQFPAFVGNNETFAMAATIRGNGEGVPGTPVGTIIQTGADRVYFDISGQITCSIHNGSGGGTAVATPVAIDLTKTHRIFYWFTYNDGRLYIDGSLATSVGSFPNYETYDITAMVDSVGYAVNDINFWGYSVSPDSMAIADYERYASSFRP